MLGQLSPRRLEGFRNEYPKSPTNNQELLQKLWKKISFESSKTNAQLRPMTNFSIQDILTKVDADVKVQLQEPGKLLQQNGTLASLELVWSNQWIVLYAEALKIKHGALFGTLTINYEPVSLVSESEAEKHQLMNNSDTVVSRGCWFTPAHIDDFGIQSLTSLHVDSQCAKVWLQDSEKTITEKLFVIKKRPTFNILVQCMQSLSIFEI